MYQEQYTNMAAIPVSNILLPKYPQPYGSLQLTNTGDGAFGRKTNATITFDRTRAYTWSFFLKLAQDDTRFQQLILHGSLGSRGYRINKNYVGGRHCLELQEVKNYTARRLYYPKKINPYEDHHIQISWQWNGATGIWYRFYINGIELSETDSALTWSNFVNTISTDKLEIGYDWNQQTLNGYIHHIRYYEGVMLQNNDAYIGRKQQLSRIGRRFIAGRWDAQDGGGSILHDSERGNDLTLYNNSYITSPDASRSFTSRWPSGLQFNYGQFTQHGPGFGSIFMVEADLNAMWSMGARKIRHAMATMGWATGLNESKDKMLMAKQRGFYVIGVCNPEGGDDATWSTTESQVYDFAIWAEANGIDEVQVTNEMDAPWKTPNLSNRHQKICDLGTLVKTVYNGVVSNAAGQDGIESEWINDPGPFDRHGYNVYGANGDVNDWKNKITTFKAGIPTAYISEFNLHHNWPFIGTTESEQADLIQDRLEWLRDESDIEEAHFFTYRWSTLVNDQFALVKSSDGKYREWIHGLAIEN